MEWLGLASGGMSLLKGLMKALRGGSKQGYEMSPEERQIYEEMMKEYKGPAPSWLTAPYLRGAKQFKEQMSRQPGVSGEVSAIESRDYLAPMGEAIKGYKQGMLGRLANFVGGRGTQTTQPGWGEAIGEGLGEGAEDIGFLLALQRLMGDGGTKKSGGFGGGMQYSPGWLR